MIKREIIARESRYYRFIRFRWLLYLLIVGFFMQRLFLFGLVKAQYQKDLFAEMENAGVLDYYEYNPPKWLKSIPKSLRISFESWGFYELSISTESPDAISFVKDLPHFSNIRVISLSDIYAGRKRNYIGLKFFLEYIAKIEGIEKLSINCNLLHEEDLVVFKGSKLRTLYLQTDYLNKGCLKVIGSFTGLKDFSLTVSQHFPSEELKYLENPELESLSLNWNSLLDAPKNFFGKKLKNLPNLLTVKYLKTDSFLSDILSNIEKFPSLERLDIIDNTVRNDEQINLLIAKNGLNFKELTMGLGVTVDGINKLKNLKKVNALHFPIHNDLSGVQWKYFTHLTKISFPPFFDLKKFFKEHNTLPKLQSIHSPGTVIDLETAELMVKAKILTFPESYNSLSDETKKLIEDGNIALWNNAGSYELQTDVYSIKDAYKVSASTIFSEKLLSQIYPKDKNYLELYFNRLSRAAALEIAKFKELEELTIELINGAENLSYLNSLKKLNTLMITYEDSPNSPIELNDLKALTVYPMKGGKLSKLLRLNKMTSLQSLVINTENSDKEFIIDDLDQLPKLETVTVSGKFMYQKGLQPIILKHFNYYSNNLEILKSIQGKRESVSPETFAHKLPPKRFPEFEVKLSYQSDSKHLKALLPYAMSIYYLDLRECDLNSEDFEMLKMFKNLHSLHLPKLENKLSFSTLQKILQLPELRDIYLNYQIFTVEELNQLSKEERKKLNHGLTLDVNF